MGSYGLLWVPMGSRQLLAVIESQRLTQIYYNKHESTKFPSLGAEQNVKEHGREQDLPCSNIMMADKSLLM